MKVSQHYMDGVFYLDVPSESRVWLSTINQIKGQTVYNERLFKKEGTEYRTWDSFKSKFAACLQEGMKGIPDLASSRILYLGAATGTTVSHISDIINKNEGKIVALEFSTKAARRLIQLSSNRPNIMPLVADARNPGEYASMVGVVDFIFQDISQLNQAQIFIDNAKAFLKNGGLGIFIVKAASIDSTKSVESVTDEQIQRLKDENFSILEVLDISKYEKEHRAILVKNGR